MVILRNITFLNLFKAVELYTKKDGKWALNQFGYKG